MKEITGDLFNQECDAICITTNGVIKKDGSLVMGKGCALEAKEKYPILSSLLPVYIALNGNIPILVDKKALKSPYHIISFPTKNHWKDKSDLNLILKSCDHLMKIIDFSNLEKVILPRPGCGCGGLDWTIVKEKIQTVLDDRVYIISKNVIGDNT